MIEIQMVNKNGIYTAAPKWHTIKRGMRKRQHPLRWVWALLGLIK